MFSGTFAIASPTPAYPGAAADCLLLPALLLLRR
jgi:hypothetical protein